MSTEPSPGSDVSVTHLLTGIIADAQELGLRHLALFRSELLRDVRETRTALALVAIGLVLVQVGGLLVCHMLALLISRLAPAIPLWGCYAIVGGVVTVCGAVPLMAGISRLNTLSPSTDVTTKVLKETDQ